MYRRLTLDPNLSTVVRDFIRLNIEDLQFSDVHCLLKLPMKSRSLPAGCNFAASSVLLSAIGGISTVLYSQVGTDHAKYVGVLEKFYPWIADDPTVVPTWGATTLYKIFRNPLAHALGLTDTVKKGLTTYRTPSTRAVGIGKGSLTEKQIETLERSPQRPPFLLPTLVDVGGNITLHPETLYWGCRRMVETLSTDSARMSQAEKFLA